MSRRGEFADHFLNDVLHRQNPQHLAVLVHHHAEPLFVLLKMLQLLKNRGLGRDEIRFAHAVADFIDGQGAVLQVMQGFADVKNPQDVVQFAVVHRQFIVVAGHQLMADGVNIVIDVQRLDFRARRHQIVDLHFLQIKQIDQNAFVLFRHQRRLLQHQRTDFFAR